MHAFRFGWALSAGLVVAGLVGCGGHGEGFRVGANPIVIQTTALPPINSGEILNFALDFTGGGGGPYILEVIDGALPGGVALDNNTVGLTGRPLVNGTFHFTIKLTDTGTQPFATTTKSFEWVVGIGALVFVTDADLPDWIFNGFDAAQLVVAGGVAPYTCEVVDDPLNPQDEPLPAGLSVPTDSCTIVGAPTGVKSSAPFIYKVSVRATDANFQTVTKEFTVTVLVPPIVIITTSLANGKCGAVYSDGITLADGIPPFNHTLVDAVNSTNKLVGEPGTPGGVAKGAPLSAYAPDSTAGPYSGKFPEGLVLRETDGNISGSPRRQGGFSNFVYRANSVVLPLVPSQNAWKSYTFAMADSVPPNVALDAVGVLSTGSTFSATLVAANAPGANNFMIRSPEFGVAFNPIQFKATAGVPADGKFDAPHTSQAANNAGEAVGGYDWSASTFPGGIPSGMAFSATGLFSGTPTARSGFQVFNPVVRDYQLPTPVAAAHTAAGFCRFDIGPDWVVITESATGSSGTTVDATMDYNSQRVEILEPKTGVPVVRALSNALDMALTHTHPLSGGTLDGSLTAVDFLRVTVNPTWWAYDAYNVNASGARVMQHGDPERFVHSQTFGGDTQKSQAYPNGPNQFPEGFEHASNPAIEIPEARGTSPFTVTHNPAAGVYANGGLLYGYDKSGEFGFFIVRKDSKIQIPVAFNKSTFTGFGDAWISSSSSKTGLFRIPQITVSPDGRMAAAKLKISVDNFPETVSAGEKVVIFSLTGEKPFGGATFVVINAGGAGNTTDGQYLYADSLALTNHGLYALRGNNRGDLGDRVIYGDHWVWHADIFNPTTGAYLTPTTMFLLSPSFGGVGGWTNTTGSPISCTYCKWGTTGGSSLPSFGGSTWVNTTAAANNTSPSVIVPAVFGDNWANFGDSSGAPAPFRVSANGMACAMIAGSNATAAAVNTVNFLKRSIYVDFGETFREAATTLRRYQPAARLVGERGGEQSNLLYGAYDGPETQFELSDAGDRLAIVYNASAQSWTNFGSSNCNFTDAYEAISAIQGTGASTDPWASKTETLVTHPAGTPVFVNSVQWRMGSLAFTRDGKAFVFWAGYGMENPTSFSQSYVEGGSLSGSIYAYTFGTTSVDGILPATSGGHSDITGTSKNYTTSAQLLHPTSGYTYSSGAYNGGQGAVLPIGGFVSNDGNFYWFTTLGAITTSDPSGPRLIGVNVKDTTSTINTRVALRAFAPTWTSQRGFHNGTYAYPGTTVRGMGGPSGAIGDHVSAAGHPGLLFFSSNMQPNSGSQDFTGVTGGGPMNPTYWGDRAAYSGNLYGLDTSVGGNLFNLSNLGNDTSQANARSISYIQTNRSASRVSFVVRKDTAGYPPGFANYGQGNPNAEQLRIVSNVAVSSTGALSGTPAVAILEGATTGRVSSSIALDFSDRRVYYGYSTTGNENGMKLTEKTLDGTGAVASTRTFNGISGTSNRFSVLWSGR